MVFGPGKALIKRENHSHLQRQEHMATYKLDVVPQHQKRLLWIHRDQSEEGIQNDSAGLLKATNQIERIKQRPLI